MEGAQEAAARSEVWAQPVTPINHSLSTGAQPHEWIALAGPRFDLIIPLLFRSELVGDGFPWRMRTGHP